MTAAIMAIKPRAGRGARVRGGAKTEQRSHEYARAPLIVSCEHPWILADEMAPKETPNKLVAALSKPISRLVPCCAALRCAGAQALCRLLTKHLRLCRRMCDCALGSEPAFNLIIS